MAGLGLSLGLGLTSRGASGPSVVLSATSILESAVSGSTVGVLSVVNHPSGSSGWTFAETADPDNKFAVSGANLNTSAALNYETATSHSVTITASKVGQDDIVRVFTITVTNVLEVTLAALALDSLSFAEDTADSGSITGKTSGSTVTLVGSLPTGLTLDLTGMTWAWDGTGTLSDGSFTLRETHADASNSPRDSVQSWEIVEASVTPTAIVAIAFGDSTWEGVIGPRDAGDTDWTGVYEVKVDNSLSSDITPMRRFAGPSDSLCPQEYWGKQRHADTGLPVYMVQHAIGGSALQGASPDWAAPSGTNLVNAVSRANAAIQAVIAAVGGPVQVEFTGDIGTNDFDPTTWYALCTGMVAHFRNNVYKNGVSGATCTDSKFGFVIPQPEHARGTSDWAQIAMHVRRVAGLDTNCVIFQPAEGQTVGDNLHPTLAGARANGTGLAVAFTETVAPTISFSDFTIYSGQKLSRQITADKIAWFTLSGADAALFEIAEIPRSTNYGGGDTNAAYIDFYLRWAGNGDAPAAGTYNVTINAKGNAATSGTKNVTVTVAAAYGSQVEAIVPTWTKADGFTNLFNGTMRMSSVPLKRGLNIFTVLKVAGSADISTSAVASNGLVGVRNASSDGNAAEFYFYSAQDDTVSITVSYTGSGPGIWGFNVNLVGTVATPTAYETTTSATTSSMTCPTNGIIICAGYATGGTTPTSGATGLTDSPTDGAMYSCYRTTTGAIGAQGGFARLIATSWAKA